MMEAAILPEINEGKLKLFKTYPTEIFIFFLVAVIGYQGLRQNNLETKVDQMYIKQETYMQKDQQAMLKTISESTEATKENTRVTKDVADYLRIHATQEALKD